MLKRNGLHGFIVPKSLMFSSREWIKTREALLGGLVLLVDVGKVWKEVKLEQCVYVVRGGQNTPTYSIGSRCGDSITLTTDMDKRFVPMFGVFPSVGSNAELRLGQKIVESSRMLSQHITNRRGGNLSRHRTDSGIAVVGGKQIQPYRVNGVKFYADAKNVDYKKASVASRSVLVQRLVAHVTTPTDHIRIIATIPQGRPDFVVDETVNQLTVAEPASPHFVLGLLHSRLINWYAYRFVFSKGIRSIQFDPPTTNKIPIRISKEGDVAECVKAMLDCHSKPVDSPTRARIKALDDELNLLFYEIFELTEEEIRMVEGSL